MVVIIVVAVFVLGLVVVGGVAVVAIVGHSNLTLKFGQNLVNNKQCIVVIVLVLLLLLLMLLFLIQKPSLKLGPNQVIDS